MRCLNSETVETQKAILLVNVTLACSVDYVYVVPHWCALGSGDGQLRPFGVIFICVLYSAS